MKEIRNKKIINGIIGFVLFFVILFAGFWLIDNKYTIELKAQEVNINLAVPNLTDKEYLGDGSKTITNVFNNIIQWETFLTVLDGLGEPFELQVAKIKMDGTGFRELSYNNLNAYYNLGMPAEVFQMYLLDNTYNHYFINSLDYRSWYNELWLPLNDYQLFSLTGAPNVEMSLFGYRGLDSLNINIDAFLGGYPNDSGNWFLIRNTKTIDEYSYDYGYDKGINDGYDDGYDVGRQDGYNLGYDYGLTENPNNNFGSMITTILLGVGTVLGIELLPNITIGAIIAVPIVFGIIAFVLGRRKD